MCNILEISLKANLKLDIGSTIYYFGWWIPSINSLQRSLFLHRKGKKKKVMFVAYFLCKREIYRTIGKMELESTKIKTQNFRIM